MNREENINWGILGTSRHARKRMIKAIQETEGCTCLAVAGRDKKKAGEVAGDFNIPKYYGSYDELIDDGEIDAVYIPLPNSLHHPWVIRAAEKGKHILCEKPLGLSVSQVKEMIRICERQDVLLMEAMSYFLHPRYVRLFDLLAEGVVGPVRQIQVHFSFPAQKHHAIRFQHELGGGSLLDIGCYGIDLAHRVCKSDTRGLDAVFDMENKIDMEFLGVLGFQNNTEAIIRTSFRRERQQTLLVSGEKGNIFLPDAFIPGGDKASMVIARPGGVEIETIQNVDQYGLLVREFREQIHSKENTETRYDGYLRNMDTLERFLRLQTIGG